LLRGVRKAGERSEFLVQNAQMIGGAVSYDLARPQRTRLGHRLIQRPSTATDHDFLLTLFAESRPEFALLPDSVRIQLIGIQFDSQLTQYRSSAPDAVDWILELDSDGRREPVGRCYLWHGPQAHRLLDLAIRSQWRRQGIAGMVLDRLCAGAEAAGVPLRLTVWRDNHDAMRLYHRYGFAADDAESGPGRDVAGYLSMHWSARGAR
jgi:ribosomal protein S18 acetylase RimI-like enzyme